MTEREIAEIRNLWETLTPAELANLAPKHIFALLDEVDRLRADLEMAQDEINDLANQLGG